LDLVDGDVKPALMVETSVAKVVTLVERVVTLVERAVMSCFNSSRVVELPMAEGGGGVAGGIWQTGKLRRGWWSVAASTRSRQRHVVVGSSGGGGKSRRRRLLQRWRENRGGRAGWCAAQGKPRL
jgi:hypothetical protein